MTDILTLFGRADSEPQRVRRVDYLGPITFVESESDEAKLDEGSFAARLTSEGFLKIDGFISGTGVYTYSDGENTWGELRTAAEVFAKDSLASFQMVPVTDDHPSEMVDATNISDLQKGHLGSNVRPDGAYVRADMLITDAALIEKIKAGKTQLSNGYEAVVTTKDGMSDDGIPFQAIQSKIVGNHTAIVDLARGGPTCRLLLDSKDGAFSGDDGMSIKKKNTKDGAIEIEGTEHEVPDAVAEAFRGMMAKIEEQGAELAKQSADESGDEEMEDAPAADAEIEVEEEMEDKKTDSMTLAKMQAKIDSMEAALKTEREGASSRIDARVSLVTSAREVLGADIKTDGVSDIAIQRAVVASVTPSMKAKVDAGSADYVQAAYEMALDTHSNKVDSTDELLVLTHEANKSDSPAVDLDALYKAHCDGLRNGVLTKEMH